MRSFRHWTPRYLYDRAVEELYCRTHPDTPWLTPAANSILSTILRPDDEGLEFGAGRSTLWLAPRVSRLTSVEHDQVWHGGVSTRLVEKGLANVNLILAPRDVPENLGGESRYARVATRFGDDSLDFVLVDGAYRDHCTQLAIPKVRSGGLIIIDNINWFLPSASRSPQSRRPAEGPDGPVWTQAWQTLRGWRSIWTSSGVWDTAIFVKP